MQHNSLPETGYLRLSQIVGDKKAGIAAIIPVSKSTWWQGVKSGRYPQPVKLSERCTAWRVEDVLALIDQTASGWYPDSATALLKQVRHDLDSDALRCLMTEWYEAFCSTPTTVRKAVDQAVLEPSSLLDAMRELPVEERGEINRLKLGWLLKKNANRIVGGFEFQQAEADGRTAWRVVAVKSSTPPPLTPSPPFTPPVDKTVSGTKRAESLPEKQPGRGTQMTLFGCQL